MDKLKILVFLLYSFPFAIAQCPSQAAVTEGYAQPSGSSYYYKAYAAGSMKTDYLTARKQCEKFGARLAMFKTQTDLNNLVQIATAPGVSQIWVGLESNSMTNCQNSACSNVLTWIDGSGFTLSPFWMPSINVNQNLPCLGMASNGGSIGDGACTQQLAYVCQLDCSNVYNALGCTAPQAGYQKLDGYYYKIGTNLQSLWNAQVDCSADNANVAMINSGDDYNFIRKMEAYLNTDIWTGLINPGKNSACKDAPSCDGIIRNMNGTFLTSAQSWFTGTLQTPGSTGSTICYRMTNQYSIINEPCSNARAYICVYCKRASASTCACQSLKDPCSSSKVAGYTDLFGQAYHVAPAANEQSAVSNCNNINGGNLVEFQTEAQYDALLFLQDMTGSLLYVGLTGSPGLLPLLPPCDGKMNWLSTSAPFNSQAWMTFGVSCHNDIFNNYPCFIIQGNQQVVSYTCTSAFTTICQHACGAITCVAPPLAGSNMETSMNSETSTSPIGTNVTFNISCLYYVL